MKDLLDRFAKFVVAATITFLMFYGAAAQTPVLTYNTQTDSTLFGLSVPIKTYSPLWSIVSVTTGDAGSAWTGFGVQYDYTKAFNSTASLVAGLGFTVRLDGGGNVTDNRPSGFIVWAGVRL